MSALSRSRRQARRFAWLGVLSLAAAALLLPSSTAVAASFNGAIWTSLANGATVNANLYDLKTDVYLNGGPQNCGNSNGLPDGLYYFEVTDPSNSILLSSDAIAARMVQVVNGVIAGVGGTGTHNEGTTNCVGGKPVQLAPYDDTPNNGGEYSTNIAQKADVESCDGFAATGFVFKDCSGLGTKNDNYKVAASIATPTPTPTPTPTGGVGGATATPQATRTLPPTSTIDSTGSGQTGDGWRMILLAMAGVLAAALLLTPAGAVVRKDDTSR
jgi:hypothetical protein